MKTQIKNKKSRKGFSYLIVLFSFIVLTLATVSILMYYDKKSIDFLIAYKTEANSMIKAENNNVINYCLMTNLSNYEYYKNFNYNQQIKFILSCEKKNIIDSDGNTISVIEYDLKGCREKNYIKTGNYPICLKFHHYIRL